MTARIDTLLAVVAFACVLSGARVGYAYHNADFVAPVASGGGNGIYFTGSPRYKGYDCSICHALADEAITVELSSTPAELIDEGRWTPGQTYQIDVVMLGEHLGDSNSANGYDHNSFVAEVNDDAGDLVGEWLSDDPASVYTMAVAGGDPRVAIGYSDSGGTSWTVRFVAPAAGAGRLTLYLGAVDGNAAGGGVATVVDPFGDDYFAGAWRFCEAGTSCDAEVIAPTEDEVDEARRSPAGHGCTVASGGGKAGLSLVLLVVATLLLRRRTSRAVLAACLLLIACDDFDGLDTECPNGVCEYSSLGASTGTQPALDAAYFECEAQPVLQARCSLFACHGDGSRPLLIYAPNRLRLDGENEGEQVELTTALESASNYESATRFARDDSPEKSLLLLKPLDTAAGGYYHFGESLYYQGDVFESSDDVGYQKLRAWIAGAASASDCEPTMEVGL